MILYQISNFKFQILYGVNLRHTSSTLFALFPPQNENSFDFRCFADHYTSRRFLYAAELSGRFSGTSTRIAYWE
jgi:hypothetical protein